MMSKREIPLASADEIDAQGAEWFIARNEPSEWTDATQAEFDAWLAQSPKHQLAYWRAEAGWERAGLLSAVRPPARGDARARRVLRPWSVRIVSVAALAAIAVVASYYWIAGRAITYATPVGGHRVITLADGSRIELNTDTVVRLLASQRSVELAKGEVFFRVKHDAAYPFIVKAGGQRLVDLGTEFFVRNEESRVRVGLVEGRVRLENSIGQTLLAPGDIASAAKDGVSIKHNAARELADDLAWRSGHLVFHRASLADAVAEFNRYNARKLVIADNAVGKLTFSSVFSTNAIDAFARTAQKSLGLSVMHRGEDIVISR
ncbi:MAG TPA: FecR domain-containing protein [Rhizomicrobium sp.]|jgi:transmembrane sensor|nr:FecR domain-containing protein [Rhizomicrobium sp.]